MFVSILVIRHGMFACILLDKTRFDVKHAGDSKSITLFCPLFWYASNKAEHLYKHYGYLLI